MRIIADLHIHSRFSRASGKKITAPLLERWARIKGLDLIGSGDCTHPLWLAELREQLEEAGGGFYRLRREFRSGFEAAEMPQTAPDRELRFVLSGEISTIYKSKDKTRKVHHLILVPDFKAAAAVQRSLGKIAGIIADGRPVLGIDSRDLLALLLEADERIILIPAHIWTPWFSVLGAKSGFDSIEECYGDLASRIPAVETGLSSNPPMNWALPSLDRYAIISNSDAHSPEKLGREATIFDMEADYAALAGALRLSTDGGPRLLGTIELFPQAGKYHYDGHRKCGASLTPAAAAGRGGICPVCGRALTRGVLGRVLELAKRPVDETAPCPPAWEGGNRRPYWSLIPLKEVLAEILKTGAASRRVSAAYGALIAKGSELSLLMDMSGEELEKTAVPGVPGELLAAALGRMRTGKVWVSPGYDGEYGTIRTFAPGETRGVI
jgi:uncharacterized protein (TIGR00375 family)